MADAIKLAHAVLRALWAEEKNTGDPETLKTIIAGCGLDAYSSETKFESGTGWPSFWDALPGAIGTSLDGSLLMERVEVHCRRCGGHFGHVFDDGPPPTGKRHCLNGLALAFRPAAA